MDLPDQPGQSATLVVQTPYNKDGAVSIALGGAFEYLVRRGYVLVTVDVRGTGASEGQWDSSGEDEQRDGYEVVEWAAAQPWSAGRVGLLRPSYMGLNQLLTAARRPPHREAIFPIAPMADGYRDTKVPDPEGDAAHLRARALPGADWPDPRLKPRRRYLRGGGRITRPAPKAAEAARTFLLAHGPVGVVARLRGNDDAVAGDRHEVGVAPVEEVAAEVGRLHPKRLGRAAGPDRVPGGRLGRGPTAGSGTRE